LLIITLTLLAIFFLDQKIALWARAHPIPDLAGRPLAEDPTSTKYRGGDIGRELMFLEQFGQFTCSVVVILAVALIDPKGRRRACFYPGGRALFMALALITATQRVLHTAHFLSDVIAGMGLGVLVARWTLSTKFAGHLISLAPPPLRAWWQH